ncbi:serine/threonine protein kinase [Paenibacillus sp. 79R4]|nr:serine/threonine protein kinase [Paenibacillus sp. 79R4]
MVWTRKVKEKRCLVTTSSKWTLPPGTIVTGRWKGERYLIQRLLGQGANGVVYLVKQVKSSRLYALKMGFDTIDLQSEINVLKALQRRKRKISSTGKRDLSYLVEVDDYSLEGKEIPFYVMRYVKGEPLRVFLAQQGNRWLNVAGYSLLQQLEGLHGLGFTFGDLKPENVLVSPYGEVELIDYGGVSENGRSVRQFTEWYDRGYWGAGGRTAEPSYDLFSLAVVCIHLLAEAPLKEVATGLPQTRSKGDLLAIVRGEASLQPYRKWLERALEGKFRSTAEARQLWREQVQKQVMQRKAKSPTPAWMMGAFTLSLLLLLCALFFTFWN